MASPPAAALLEFYASGELEEIARLMAERGSSSRLPTTAPPANTALSPGCSQYYDQIRQEVREEARKIWNGEFAREWSLEQRAGYPVFYRLWQLARESAMAKEEDKLYRALGRKKA